MKQAMSLGATSYFVKSNLSLQELVKQVRDTLGSTTA